VIGGEAANDNLIDFQLENHMISWSFSLAANILTIITSGSILPRVKTSIDFESLPWVTSMERDLGQHYKIVT